MMAIAFQKFKLAHYCNASRPSSIYRGFSQDNRSVLRFLVLFIPWDKASTVKAHTRSQNEFHGVQSLPLTKNEVFSSDLSVQEVSLPEGLIQNFEIPLNSLGSLITKCHYFLHHVQGLFFTWFSPIRALKQKLFSHSQQHTEHFMQWEKKKLKSNRSKYIY